MNNVKTDIEKLLFDLKKLNYDRRRIEKELAYSKNYIDQILSKGGSDKFLTRLKELQNSILQKEGKAIDVKGGGSLSMGDLATLQVRSEARLTVLLEAVAEVLAGQRGLTAADVRLSLESAVKAKEADLRVELGSK